MYELYVPSYLTLGEVICESIIPIHKKIIVFLYYKQLYIINKLTLALNLEKSFIHERHFVGFDAIQIRKFELIDNFVFFAFKLHFEVDLEFNLCNMLHDDGI